MPVPSAAAPLMNPLTDNSMVAGDSLDGSKNKSLLHHEDEPLEALSREKLNHLKLMMKSYIQGALREYAQGRKLRYNELITELSKKYTTADTPSSARLYVWLISLSQCVSQLNKDCLDLVNVVLQIDWAVRPRIFVNAFIVLIENLVSAHAFYVVPVLNKLVEGFRYRGKMPSYAVVTRTVAYDRHHEAIQDVLKLIPTSYNSLYVCIQRHLPYKKRGTADHAAYVHNLVQIMNYVPVLQKQIMTLLVEHLVRVDSLIQIEMDELDDDVEFDTYNMNFDDDYQSEVDSDMEDLGGESGESGEDGDMNGDDSDVDSDYGRDDDDDEEQDEERPKEMTTKQQRKVRSMVRKLDSMMSLVLSHVAKKQGSDERHDMYNVLLESFDRTVIKTLKSRYTQFLIFYMCSMDTHLSDHFLEHLLQLITDPMRPSVNRIAAAAYVSSYVARAKFMEPAAIQKTVAVLCAYCEQLLDHYEVKYGIDDVSQTVNAERYEIFYATLQAVMYIFCFRWRDLTVQDDSLDALIDDNDQPMNATFPNGTASTASDGKIADTSDEMDYSTLQFGSGDKKWCHGLRNMPRLVMNRLYPLKVCSVPVVRQFAKISHETSFMYIYSIMEKNKDMLIAGVNLDAMNDLGVKNLLHTVQTFFPFDPYKLESSRKYIDGIYFEWIADDDDDEDESDDEDEDEEDEENMSAGMMAMSISPSPTSHYL